jgi:hypothetical protein
LDQEGESGGEIKASPNPMMSIFKS